MGKVTRLRNRFEPSAALFWALGNVPTLHAGPTSLHVHKACPYMVIVGSILNKDGPAPSTFPI